MIMSQTIQSEVAQRYKDQDNNDDRHVAEKVLCEPERN